MNELEQENAFYEANKEEFRQKYLNKWLLITGNKLWGVYDKIAEAVEEALKQDMKPGHFMIHKPADAARNPSGCFIVPQKTVSYRVGRYATILHITYQMCIIYETY